MAETVGTKQVIQGEDIIITVDGYFWMYTRWARTSGTGTSYSYVLTRPEVKTTYTRVAGTSHGEPLVYMYGNLLRVTVSKNQIVISTDQYVYMYDSRYHSAPNVMQVKQYSKCFAVTDDYMALDDPEEDMVILVKRDSLTTYSKVRNINRYCDCCAISQTKVCCVWDSTPIYDIKDGTYALLKNYGADESTIINVFFIYGDLYIVREQGVFKYCPDA